MSAEVPTYGKLLSAMIYVSSLSNILSRAVLVMMRQSGRVPYLGQFVPSAIFVRAWVQGSEINSSKRVSKELIGYAEKHPSK